MLSLMNLPPFPLPFPQEQWRRNRLALNIAAAMVWAGFTFVMPFLPLYVKEMGVRGDADIASWSGLLLTISPLLAALLAPAWGRLGDRHGMKIMIERCALALAVHWGLFGFAHSTYQLLGLRIMLGLFGGFGTLSMPLLVASTPKEHMSRSIGMLQTVQMVSSAVGPLVGGALADGIGIRNTCLVSTLVSALALVMIRWLYKEIQVGSAGDERQTSPRRISLRAAAALPSFGTMIAVMFSVNFVERSFGPVIPLYILKLGTSMANAAKTAGLIVSLGLLAEAVSATIMGIRLRKVPPRRLLLWRLGGGIAASLPMGLIWATPQLLILRVILGLLAGGCMVVVYTLGSRIIPPETRATSFSFLSSAGMLGGAMGPLAAGLIARLSMRAVFFFNSMLFLCLLLSSWFFVQRPPSPGGVNAESGGEELAVKAWTMGDRE
jgi:DHA1 family multidrug resistance protein-like MFS transporter